MTHEHVRCPVTRVRKRTIVIAVGEWSHVATNAFTTLSFDDARQSADARAKAFNDESISSRAPIFRRLPIRDLRAQRIEALE